MADAEQCAAAPYAWLGSSGSAVQHSSFWLRHRSHTDGRLGILMWLRGWALCRPWWRSGGVRCQAGGEAAATPYTNVPHATPTPLSALSSSLSSPDLCRPSGRLPPLVPTPTLLVPHRHHRRRRSTPTSGLPHAMDYGKIVLIPNRLLPSATDQGKLSSVHLCDYPSMDEGRSAPAVSAASLLP
jgi:hypothetical protein